MTQMLESGNSAELVDTSGGDHTMILGEACRALYIGGAGDIVVDFIDGGTAIPLIGTKAGQVLPIRVTKVHQTGTTATNLVALF